MRFHAEKSKICDLMRKIEKYAVSHVAHLNHVPVRGATIHLNLYVSTRNFLDNFNPHCKFNVFSDYHEYEHAVRLEAVMCGF